MKKVGVEEGALTVGDATFDRLRFEYRAGSAGKDASMSEAFESYICQADEAHRADLLGVYQTMKAERTIARRSHA